MSFLVRPAEAGDVDQISRVIRSALRETNARDYPPEVIERVLQGFGPDALSVLMETRRIVVATADDVVIGTASLEAGVVRSVFVLPERQDQGVGRRLMAELERVARHEGLEVLTVPSSITAEGFYRRLGFVGVRDVYHGEERTIVMERRLR